MDVDQLGGYIPEGQLSKFMNVVVPRPKEQHGKAPKEPEQTEGRADNATGVRIVVRPFDPSKR